MKQTVKLERWHLAISGLVQGVGFRPFLFNLARKNGLAGWVRNNFAGVELELQGEPAALERFATELRTQKPVAAVLDQLVTTKLPLTDDTQFVILPSQAGTVLGSPLPDQAICPACCRELFDPNDRRHAYPFNSCPICGPRFTIINELPFDRSHTAMAQFKLCPACQAEYDDPADRRFHGQTISCPECGPQAWFANPQGQRVAGEPFHQAQQVLQGGGIIGVKGIGGYHLACDAFNQSAVERLRQLKGRDHRPLAVMFRDLPALKANSRVTSQETAVLQGPERPILLLPQLASSRLAAAVNPGLQELGAFLPYSGIHYLLFNEQLTALVLTSGNRSGEPLTIDDQAAVRDLGPMVSGLLLHDRPIRWRCDDSVLRLQQQRLIGIRRSRGYAPAPLKVERELVPLLACGALQKNTFALTKKDQIYLSQHQGDLDEYSAYLSYQETISRWQRLIQCQPEWVVHDLHPDYNSTSYARSLGLPTLGIQHHLAHIAAVVATKQLKDPLIGVAFDGSGYGSDGRIWGGEFFSGAGIDWHRRAHLRYYPLPGGSAAILQPWRMAAAYLQPDHGAALAAWLTEQNLTSDWQTIAAAVQAGINAPPTSSMGRLFDGVAALAGGTKAISYEGEAAVWLEQQADPATAGSYEFAIHPTATGWELDPGPLTAAVWDDRNYLTAAQISIKFHRAVARLIVDVAGLIRQATGYQQVVLCGGVFQNRLLLDLSCEYLMQKGFEVVLPELVPLNDGGIACGQAWLGSLMIERGVSDVLGDPG